MVAIRFFDKVPDRENTGQSLVAYLVILADTMPHGTPLRPELPGSSQRHDHEFADHAFSQVGCPVKISFLPTRAIRVEHGVQ